MKNKPFKLFILFLLIMVVFFSFYIYYHKSNNSYSSLDYDTVELSVGKTLVKAFLSDNPQKRVRGLSGISKLEEGNGMFFVFERPDFHGIWMKNMNFPIDIIFIDENLLIVDVYKDISPQTFPKIFYPKQKSLYVLEANSGFAEKFEIKIGDEVEIEK